MQLFYRNEAIYIKIFTHVKYRWNEYYLLLCLILFLIIHCDIIKLILSNSRTSKI